MAFKVQNSFASIVGTAVIGGLGLLAFVLIIAVIGAIPVWIAWNWVVPFIFHLPEITLVQALMLNILAASFFKTVSTGK